VESSLSTIRIVGAVGRSAAIAVLSSVLDDVPIKFSNPPGQL
jgi:hypothetical protein